MQKFLKLEISGLFGSTLAYTRICVLKFKAQTSIQHRSCILWDPMTHVLKYRSCKNSFRLRTDLNATEKQLKYCSCLFILFVLLHDTFIVKYRVFLSNFIIALYKTWYFSGRVIQGIRLQA